MKVFIGLSGGVDSAVSAAILKDAGHDVVGCFIKIWQPEFIECTWREDRLDAMRVAVALGIPFKEVDLSNEYKKNVINDLLEGYARGETPNPDVLCNRSIKFGSFLSWALAEGAEKIATGHYAQVTTQNSEYALLRGIDSEKDQSYFLARIAYEALPRVLFPIGGMTKRAVRAEAKRRGLPVATKPDSQGLCFVGDVSMPEFLSRYIQITAGDVLDGSGKAIGRHEGAPLYTIGQRHGFTHTASVPLYVHSVDIRRNTITVTDDRGAIARTRIVLRNVQSLQRGDLEGGTCEAQLRYREKPVIARAYFEKNGEAILQLENLRVAAPGQVCALYNEDKLVGSGNIEADNPRV